MPCQRAGQRWACRAAAPCALGPRSRMRCSARRQRRVCLPRRSRDTFAGPSSRFGIVDGISVSDGLSPAATYPRTTPCCAPSGRPATVSMHLRDDSGAARTRCDCAPSNLAFIARSHDGAGRPRRTRSCATAMPTVSRASRSPPSWRLGRRPRSRHVPGASASPHTGGAGRRRTTPGSVASCDSVRWTTRPDGSGEPLKRSGAVRAPSGSRRRGSRNPDVPERAGQPTRTTSSVSTPASTLRSSVRCSGVPITPSPPGCAISGYEPAAGAHPTIQALRTAA